MSIVNTTNDVLRYRLETHESGASSHGRVSVFLALFALEKGEYRAGKRRLRE